MLHIGFLEDRMELHKELEIKYVELDALNFLNTEVYSGTVLVITQDMQTIRYAMNNLIDNVMSKKIKYRIEWSSFKLILPNVVLLFVYDNIEKERLQGYRFNAVIAVR
jgi:hypothetical protein